MIIERPLNCPTAPGSAVFVADAESFRQAYNQHSFAFEHRLAGHPLFAIPRLADTAQAIIDRGDGGGFVVFDAKAFATASGFGMPSRRDRLAETVRRLAEGGSWLKLVSVNETDPAYAEVLQQVIRDVSELTGRDLAAEITWSGLTVFMTSPNATTPYHIDHEPNFLLQVHGEKDICLFDQNDREVLSEANIERFYCGDPQAAHYNPDLQSRGIMYRLVPGRAVHHPPLAPHWVKNGDNVSVSVSVSFCTRSLDHRAKVYQANRLLRSIGLRPARPGQSPLRDRLKAAGLEIATKPHAVSREDILFSGFRRLTSPLRVVKHLRQGYAPHGR
jgi:hypothetical protein